MSSAQRSTLVLTPAFTSGERRVIHPDQKVLLGRTSLSDIVFDDYRVSRRHAWVWYEEGQWRVQDARSAAGTFIEQEPIGGEARPLPYGATLRLGGLDLVVSEGDPDLKPSVPVGVHPRFAGEAAEKAELEAEAARRAAPSPAGPPCFAGRFTLKDALGRGNQGIVYSAIDQKDGRWVALKIFGSLADERQIARFLAGASAKAPQQFDGGFHQHLAWGVVDWTPYLAMELTNGERLSDRLRREPLSLGTAVHVCLLLSYAVGSLHREGLLHRNIKPDNVRFSVRVKDAPLLSDIWVDMQQSLRPPYRRELLSRSLGFLAPEHARTGDATARSDVYSIAAILYLCVAGCPAIPEHDPEMQGGGLDDWASQRAQPLLEVRPDAPLALADLLARALSPSPSDRPEDGYALARELVEIEKNLGFARGQPPCRLSRSPGWRRAAPAARPPVDPFTDKEFQDELVSLVLPRCGSESARDHVRAALRRRARCGSHPDGCGMCGIPHVAEEVLEIRPDGFFAVPAEAAATARRPHLCRACTWRDYRGAWSALQATLAELAGRDDEAPRPLGPTRRELREGLSALLAEVVPHIDETFPCPRCGRRGDTLMGAETSLCLSCLDVARTVAQAQIRVEQAAAHERLRAEYAKLFVRAEARLVQQGKRKGQTPQGDVALPPRGSIADWPYAEPDLPERAARLSQAEIDQLGSRLAGAIEAHVIASLERRLSKDKNAGFSVEGSSGLPGYVRRYLAACRPGEPVKSRLDMAVTVMSELLRAGYRYEHQAEEYEWRDATGYFEIFHDLADRP